MTRSVLVALSLVCLLFNVGYASYWLGYAQAGRPAGGSARLEFSTMELELGTLEQGQVVEREVTYTNMGDAVAVIDKVASSCGCTVPRLGQARLAPGEQAAMVIAFEAGATQGPFEKTVEIQVAGGAEPYVLRVRGRVEPVLKVVPGVAKLRVGETRKFALVAQKPGLTFAIRLVQPEVDALEVKHLGETTAGTHEFEVTLARPLPPAPGGTNAFSVEVLTDIAGMPPFSFFVLPGN